MKPTDDPRADEPGHDDDEGDDKERVHDASVAWIEYLAPESDPEAGAHPEHTREASRRCSLLHDGFTAGIHEIKKRALEPTHAGKVQSADGAWWEIASVELNIRQFGAKGDGTNDSPKIQDAIDCAIALNAPLFLTGGDFTIHTAPFVSARITIYGVNYYDTIIRLNDTVMDGIEILCNEGVNFSKFRIEGKPLATGGVLLYIDGDGTPGEPNQNSVFRDMMFLYGSIQIFTESAAEYVIDQCRFINFIDVGVFIQDQANTDGGDMSIMNCLFTTVSPGVGVHQESAGGLRLVSNKFILMRNGYELNLAAGVSTSVLVIADNSFEAFTSDAIFFTIGAGVVFGAVQITGNEISGCKFAIRIDTNSGPWISGVEITGNNIGTNLANSQALTINGTDKFTIVGNTITDSGPGPSLAFNIGSFSQDGIIAHNQLEGYTSQIANAGTRIRIEGNNRYNPVGSAGETPGASPWTFTAGSSPVTLYILSDTGISSITNGGVEILPGAIAAGSMRPFWVDPNDSIIITYTGTLTARKTTH